MTLSLVIRQQVHYGASAQIGGSGNEHHSQVHVPRIGVVQRQRDGVLFGRVRHHHGVLELFGLLRAQVVDDRDASVVVEELQCLVPQQLQFDFLPGVANGIFFELSTVH